MNSESEPILDDSRNGILISPKELGKKTNKRKALAVFLLFICTMLYYELRFRIDKKQHINFIEIAMELTLMLAISGFVIGIISSLFPYKGLKYSGKLFLFSVTAIVALEVLLILLLGLNLILANRTV